MHPDPNITSILLAIKKILSEILSKLDRILQKLEK